MTWDSAFNLANLVALLGWAVLILLPRGALTGALVMYAGVGLLCLAYALGLLLVLGGVVETGAPAEAGAAGFTTIAGVRAIFASDAGVTIGWIHYLAFDLFAGLWIARDGDAKGFARAWQVPVLLLTLVAGPAGLLVWLALREPAARRSARARGHRHGQ